MTTAIYVRVSTSTQETRSQEGDLRRWAEGQSDTVIWYRDKATGTTLDRPGFQTLLEAIRTGKVDRVVIWRLDRLGRTARGLLEFFEEDILPRKIGFVSLRDAIDLSTPAGRLMVGVLASVAQFETEVRSERQRAGISAAQAANGGKVPWGGRKAGTRIRVTEEKEATIRQMYADKVSPSKIARIVGLSRSSIYRVIA